MVMAAKTHPPGAFALTLILTGMAVVEIICCGHPRRGRMICAATRDRQILSAKVVRSHYDLARLCKLLKSFGEATLDGGG
jgi:predicted small integral membrane protein